MLKLYYESDVIRVSYDPEFSLGVGEWKGFASSDEFRQTALRSLEFVNEKGISRWLTDRRNMKAIRQQDQKWTAEVFIPQLLKSSLRRMATIESKDIFNQMAIEQIIRRSGGLGSITLRNFDNYKDAMEWLQQAFEKEEATDRVITAE